MSNTIIPVILSGGSGTRLWPQSRQYLPKPFAPLFDPPLFEQTLLRINKWGTPYIVTSHRLKALTDHALKMQAQAAHILLEPQAKNTAAAIAWLCLSLIRQNKQSDVIAIFPCDHLIQNQAAFYQDIELGAKVAHSGRVVVLGVPPTYPETGFGYIEKSEQITQFDGAFSVKAFHEKPNAQNAVEYLKNGYLWNAGIFISEVKTLWEHFKKLVPEMVSTLETLRPDESNLKHVYENVQSISIDFAIMEKLTQADLAVIPTQFDWSDLGTWDSVTASNAKKSYVTESGSQNTFVYGIEGKTYSSIGVEDLIVVDTEDALLVMKTGQSQNVSQVFNQLKVTQPQVVERHVFEQRPWGDFRVLREETGYKTKLITVLPGAQLSYQSHDHRSEHWVVTQGEAEVILDDKSHFLKRGDYIFISPKQKHRLKNTGTKTLKVVEVQIGEYLGEDDIYRYEDNYGRK